MSNAIFVMRKHWLALAAIAVLIAIVLTGGTLLAANEQQQPELPTTDHQSVTDSTDPVAAVVPPAAPPAPERVPAQPADNDAEAAGLPPIVKVPPKHPNLDSNLNRLVEEAETAAQQEPGQQPSNASNAGSASAPSGEPVLVTFYIELEQVAAVRQFLEDNDVFVRNVGEDYIEAHVPPALLGAASELPGVRRVDTVIPPQPQSLGDVVSQGVALHQADAWHKKGYRGQGVKVGVIDTGYQGFSQMQGGELPGSVEARCYFPGARPPSSRLTDCEAAECKTGVCNHGTAVSETLVDVAPEVELYIANPMSRGDLRDAADWMAEQGVQVINMSLGWSFDGPGNGTSPDADSPLNTIDAAVSSGITWVNAAGNSATTTWYGRFSDPDGNGFHNFAPPNVASNWFRLQSSSYDVPDLRAFLRWDDEWGGADCDLDLSLARLNQDGYRTVVADTKIQSGKSGDNPFAWVSFELDSVLEEGIYALFITKENCANLPAWIQLTAWDISRLRHSSPGHHIANPAESDNAGMLAVAATHWWDTEYIAAYSSRGPTIDGRTKPDITGVACAWSATLAPSRPGSSCPFGGTSQASPHVAGMAALVKQRFPDYTPAQVVDYLQQNATERGVSGEDNVWGHGFAILPTEALTPTEAPASLSAITLTVGGTAVALAETFSPDTTTYTASVVHSVTKLTVSAYASHSAASVDITPSDAEAATGHQVSLAVGENRVTITVTAEDGTTRVYTLTITRAPVLMEPMITGTNPVDSGIVLVSWDAVTGAAGYVLIATNFSDPSAPTRTAAADAAAVSGQIQNLTVGDEYLVFVGVFNNDLEFELSDYVKFTAQ